MDDKKRIVKIKVPDFLGEKTVKQLEGMELTVDFSTSDGVQLSVFVPNK